MAEREPGEQRDAGKELLLRRGVGEAADGAAGAHTTWIHADDVEPGPYRSGNAHAPVRTLSMPSVPGPPKLVSNEPMRRAWSVAGNRIRAKEMCAPSGWA